MLCSAGCILTPLVLPLRRDKCISNSVQGSIPSSFRIRRLSDCCGRTRPFSQREMTLADAGLSPSFSAQSRCVSPCSRRSCRSHAPGVLVFSLSNEIDLRAFPTGNAKRAIPPDAPHGRPANDCFGCCGITCLRNHRLAKAEATYEGYSSILTRISISVNTNRAIKNQVALSCRYSQLFDLSYIS